MSIETIKKQAPKDKHLIFRLTTKKKLEIMSYCLKNKLTYSEYLNSLIDKEQRENREQINIFSNGK